MDKIAIIGLGYVGLPLAVEFGKIFDVVGFDINQTRIEELQAGYDRTLEIEKSGILMATRLTFSTQVMDLKAANYYIITVPTPIDQYKKPDLKPLIEASKTIATVLKKNDIVIYESTVYPGCTEEVCVPILEQRSGLKFNNDFFVGYSPERINPGDKEHRVTDIKKVTSGSTPAVADSVNQLYQKIIRAGTYKATSIKVAEAAKVIENSQRDINIAFINELAMIFQRIGIDTHEVLQAASTKWNFLNFKPGLVGGHCIGVDPYYLTHKAESLGYHPEVILSGRRINDNMGIYVATQVIKLMAQNKIPIVGGRILVLGVTFKENCSDIRNSRVVDVVKELAQYGTVVDLYDPHADAHEVEQEYNLRMLKSITHQYDTIILAVSHQEFASIDLEKNKTPNAIVYDIKGFLPQTAITARL